MKVFLTHGYFLNSDPREKKIMKPYPPLGLLYISAYLNENKVDNHVFDSTFSSYEQLIASIREEQPDILAIYTNLMTKLSVLQLIESSRTLLPNVKIVLGGPDVTYNVTNYLTYGADILVIGEGEQTMLELVYCLGDSSKDLSTVDGIAYRDENGVEITTRMRQKIKSIDELPMPNREAINITQYMSVWKAHHGESALNISTQRGCPYTCKWCSTAVYGQSYRRRRPEKVVDELVWLQEKYNPDTYWFVDDVFNVSHKWLDAFVEELEARKVKIKFECITRADRLNVHVIAQLKKAGCFRVWIGAESGSQAVIDKMDRRVSVDQVRNMIVEGKKAGLETGTFIMVGYPGETEEDILETIHHLKKSNPDHYTVTTAYPIKGTSLYNEIADKITEEREWNASTDRDIDFRRTFPKAFYKHAIRLISSEISLYRHDTYDWKRVKLLLKIFLSRFIMRLYKSSPSAN